MANPVAPVLDSTNSRLFEPRRTRPKHAVIRWEPAEYELSWGTQRFDGPHVVVDADDHQYGVDLSVFFATHEPDPEHEHCYFKTARIRAMRVSEDTDLVTTTRGAEEARSTVRAGGWIVQNPDGEQYYNAAEEFEARYEPAGDD